MIYCAKCGELITEEDNVMFLESEDSLVHEECFIEVQAEKKNELSKGIRSPRKHFKEVLL